MEPGELRKKILQVIDKGRLGSVATIRAGRPWVRYMVIQRHDDTLEVYTTSFAKAKKINDIRKDNNVHVTIGGDPHDFGTPYVNIQGTAEVLEDEESKKKCWFDMLSKFFTGPEDPNYVVIKIIPRLVEYTAPGAHAPEVYLPAEGGVLPGVSPDA